MNDLDQFRKAINTQNIDGRTSDGITLKRIQEGLAKGGNNTLRDVFINAISFNLLLERKIMDAVINEQTVVTKKGKLNATIKELKDVRKETLQYFKLLRQIDKESGQNQGGDALLEDIINE